MKGNTGFFFLALAVVAGIVPARALAEIQPHRATYLLKMETAAPGSGIVGIEGAMRFALERTCDGWVMGQDVRMSINMATGDLIQDRYRFASFETMSGESYRFISSDTSDVRVERIRGHATKENSGGEAVFQEPREKTIPLSEKTLFPIEHMILLIEKAKAGKRNVSEIVFDGTKVDGAQRVAAFITDPLKIEKELVERFGPLVNRTGWTMRLAYFSQDKQDGAPEVEVEGYQLDNGVSPRIVVDYGAFTAKMDMQTVEAVKNPDCN